MDRASSFSEPAPPSRLMAFSTALAVAVLLEFCLPYVIDGSQPNQRAMYVTIAVFLIPSISVLLAHLLVANAKPPRLLIISIPLQVSATLALLGFVIAHDAFFPAPWPPNAELDNLWPILLAAAIGGAVTLVAVHYLLERLNNKQLGVFVDLLLGLLLAALVAAATRVIFSSTSLEVSSQLQGHDVGLNALFPVLLLLSGLLVALTARLRGTGQDVGPLLICLAAICLSFPATFAVDYYHAHPVVAPAHQLITSGGVLLLDIFSQYGAGPVLLSAAAQMTGLPPFEITAFAIQALTSLLMLIGCALVILPLRERRWLAAGALVLILLASPMLLFGKALYNLPSLFLWRFLLPTIIVISLFCLHRRPWALAIVSGALLGLSPYWSLEAVGLSAAVIFSYLLFVLAQGWAWRKVIMAVAVILASALSVSAALAGIYLASFGHFPRFEIQLEMIATYTEKGAWQWRAAPETLFYVFPLIVTAGYAIFFVSRFLDRFRGLQASASARETETPQPDERAWLALHLLATLTAIGSLYYIGRSAGWVLPGAMFFGALFAVLAACLVFERQLNSGLPFRAGAVAVLAAIVPVSSAAINLILLPKGPGEEFQIVGSTLAKWSLPQLNLKDLYVEMLGSESRSPIAKAAAPYIEAGRPVEVITGNEFVAELIHIAYDLPYYLPVSAYLTDSLSSTRSRELIAASERLPDHLIIVTNTLATEKKLIGVFRSVSADIMLRLRSLGRLCRLNETKDVIVYEHVRGSVCSTSPVSQP